MPIKIQTSSVHCWNNCQAMSNQCACNFILFFTLGNFCIMVFVANPFYSINNFIDLQQGASGISSCKSAIFQCQKLKFVLLEYFGLKNRQKLEFIFICKNRVLNMIYMKLIRDTTMKIVLVYSPGFSGQFDEQKFKF